MERRWSIRAYREGDEKGILELWRAVHPEREYNFEHWVRWWKWMYKDNPVGHGKIWLADDDGRIVGHYPLIFMMLKVGNQILKVSQNIDQMTHPHYRHQGIALKLGRQALDQAEQEEVYITIGFANEASYAVDIKTGWFYVGTMQFLFKPLNWRNTLTVRIENRFLLGLCAIGGNLVGQVLYRTRKVRITEGLTITQVYSFDERINQFWSRVSNQYEIMVVRNKDYLNWRYVAVPGANYSIYIAQKGEEIYGYLVLQCIQREYRKVAIIFDILAQSEQIAQFLISKAIERYKQEKVDVIYCSMIANKAYLKAFKKNGFILVPFVKGSRFIAYSSSPDIPKEFLKDPRNWLVQMGDSDAI